MSTADDCMPAVSVAEKLQALESIACYPVPAASVELIETHFAAAANATPVIVAKLARKRWAWPLDFGYVLPDGERLFGSHKTWRGLVSGTLAATIAAAFMQLPLWVGASFALTSLIIDALSSAVKRRMKLPPGTETVGLDQLGEALVPLVLFARWLSLDSVEVLIVTVAFAVLDIALARLRHRSWLQ